MLKPYSQACENNSLPILLELKRLLSESESVLEIGSGSGQHAVFFGQHLPHLQWQPSDLLENHEGICMWIDESGLQNVLPPIELDLSEDNDDIELYDVVFMSNVFHIVSTELIASAIQLIRNALKESGLLIIYGPFNYNNQFTSESNKRFDQWLKAADVERGIRDFEKINKQVCDAGFIFKEDISMPSNNRLLVWQFEG